MLERDLKKIVLDAMRGAGHYVEKTHGGRYSAGVPDIIACLKHKPGFDAFSGQFCTIELKVVDFDTKTMLQGIEGLPTALQLKSLRDSAKAGGFSLIMALSERTDFLYTQRIHETATSMPRQKAWPRLNADRYTAIMESLEALR